MTTVWAAHRKVRHEHGIGHYHTEQLKLGEHVAERDEVARGGELATDLEDSRQSESRWYIHGCKLRKPGDKRVDRSLSKRVGRVVWECAACDRPVRIAVRPKDQVVAEK